LPRRRKAQHIAVVRRISLSRSMQSGPVRGETWHQNWQLEPRRRQVDAARGAAVMTSEWWHAVSVAGVIDNACVNESEECAVLSQELLISWSCRQNVAESEEVACAA